MRYLFILFVLTPLAELILLVKMGRLVGFWPTIGLVLLTGVIGAALVRHQGFAVWRRFQVSIAEGRLPTEAILDGIVILVSAAFLLTPGILTDALGFVGLVPAFRSLIRRMISSRLRVRAHSVGWRSGESQTRGGADQSGTTEWQGEPSRKPQHRGAITG